MYVHLSDVLMNILDMYLGVVDSNVCFYMYRRY